MKPTPKKLRRHQPETVLTGTRGAQRNPRHLSPAQALFRAIVLQAIEDAGHVHRAQKPVAGIRCKHCRDAAQAKSWLRGDSPAGTIVSLAACKEALADEPMAPDCRIEPDVSTISPWELTLGARTLTSLDGDFELDAA